MPEFAKQESDRIFHANTRHARRICELEDQVVRGSAGKGPGSSMEIGKQAIKVFVEVVDGKGK
jgi:hypothetical protein